MLIYSISLCAAGLIAYLIQFQTYSHYHHISLGADLFKMIEIPIENEFEFELVIPK
jgi:hypothetical protein